MKGQCWVLPIFLIFEKRLNKFIIMSKHIIKLVQPVKVLLKSGVLAKWLPA